MESKKINQLATSVNPSTSDLAIIGDPITGVSKKITWLQVSSLIGTAANLQQVTDNGATTTNPITIGGLTISGLSTGVLKSDSGVISSVPFGAANGVATLGGDGKVPSSQLPSYVDDVVEVANYAALPVTGETGKIYITLDNNKVYRWTGSIYVEIAANNAVWGSITGTLSNQTDLQNALNAKVPTSRILTINGTSYDLSADRSWSITEAQTLITEVYNETGATLTKGTIVYINGGHGNLPTITKALASGDSTSAQTYGVVQTDITNNNNGYVVVTGRISNIDTQAYTTGTQLYLSGTTAGTWTSTKPYAPIHLVYVGIVVRSHPTQGIIEVKIQNGYELDELHNVSAQTPSNNDGLFYNSLNALWEARSLNSVIGYTPVSSTGTTNYIPKFTTSTNIGDSLIYDNGTNIGIGTASPAFKLDVSGTARFTGQLTLGSTITNGTYTYTLPGATGVLALTSDLTFYVTLGTLQTITGTKIYSSLQYFDNNVYIKHGISGSSSGYTTLGASASGLNINLASGTSNNSLNFASTSASNTYTLPNATGTIALTTDLSSYVPTSRTLTINGTTYDLSADRSWTITAGVSGSGTTNYISKFTGTSAIGNSGIYEGASGFVSIGNTNTTYNLDVTGTGRFTNNVQLDNTSPVFIVNGTSTYYGGLSIRQSGVEKARFAANSVSGAYVYSPTFNGFAILSDTISPLVITTAGNVGIGITNPTQRFQVYSTASTTSSIFETNNVNSYIALKSTSGTNYIGNVSYGMSFEAGGSERMRISSAGNVGIGTTTISTNTLIRQLVIGQNISNGVTKLSLLSDSTSQSAEIALSSYLGENLMAISTLSNSPMLFQTNSTERMRITSGGQVQVKQAADTHSYGFSLYNVGGQIWNFVNGGDNNLYLGYNTTSKGYFSYSTGAYTAISDVNKKKDFEQSTIGLNAILNLKPTLYRMKGEENTQKHLGFIAQEVKEFIPQAYSESINGDNNFIGLTEMPIIAALVKAIQELKAEIDELKNK